MNQFIKELRRITGVSEEYANAAWYTIHSTESPVVAANYYANRFYLRIKA